jgi:hypothetical protein
MTRDERLILLKVTSSEKNRPFECMRTYSSEDGEVRVVKQNFFPRGTFFLGSDERIDIKTGGVNTSIVFWRNRLKGGGFKRGGEVWVEQSSPKSVIKLEESEGLVMGHSQTFDILEWEQGTVTLPDEDNRELVLELRLFVEKDKS